MSLNPTELFTKKETRARLKLSRQKYRQGIESGILPEPFEIASGSRKYHSEAQFRKYENNLYERAVVRTLNRRPGARPIKPFSEETKAQILRAANK